MPKTYAQVEKRVNQAIDAIQMRGKVNRNKIAKEFCVLVQKLQLQLNKHLSATTVQEVHGKCLAPNQEKALHAYFVQLDKSGMPTHLHMIEQVANLLLWINVNPATLLSRVGPQWAQC